MNKSSHEGNVNRNYNFKISKKNLKEYFIQAVMIFLAVMLGFIADNIRENISEQNQAKEFATSMILDLKADTTELRQYINYMTYASNNIDTLMSLVSSKKIFEIPSGELYWYGLWGGAQFPFIPNDATYQQMKNSGSLRFITNNTLSKDIADYDQLCRRTLILEETDRDLYVEVRKARASIFEYQYNNEANKIYQENKILFSREKINTFINSNPPLLTKDKVLFNQYLELVRSRAMNKYATNADTLLNHAANLIDELKRAYDLN